MCIAKAVVRKDNMQVVGLHIAAPNAGEIIQGVAIGFRKGLFYKVCDGIYYTLLLGYLSLSMLYCSCW
jgi:pyruvate/2-oxoglutarate dehydrogenase complex dihydrolipoamide dehydrogenase (E3) component